MGDELRFALKCRASKQRPRLRRNCSNCLDEKEAFVGDSTGRLSTLDAFNRKTRSCLNINQEDGNTNFVPTASSNLVDLPYSSNSNLFHSTSQIKQPQPPTITPTSIRRQAAGLYHRNVSNNLQTFSKENENYPQFLSKHDYYRFHCANKNQNQNQCEHYALDHHS